MREPRRTDTRAPTDQIRVLVAGVGNVFLRDDGFGSEVARRLTETSMPEGARVCDYGIGGIHLAYDLLEGYETLVLIDTTSRGGEPGEVYVIDVDHGDLEGTGTAFDGHSMDPAATFATLRTLGGTPPPTMMVACEPADTSDGMGLTEPVEAAVDVAVEVVHELLEDLLAEEEGDGEPEAAVSAAPESGDPGRGAYNTTSRPPDRRADGEEG